MPINARQLRIGGLMVAIAYFAIISFMVKSQIVLTLVLITFHSGVFLVVRGHGWLRRFGGGLAAACLAEMSLYWPLLLFFRSAIVPRSPLLAHLLIDLNSRWSHLEIVLWFELFFGLPMVLLAVVIGVMIAAGSGAVLAQYERAARYPWLPVEPDRPRLTDGAHQCFSRDSESGH